MDDRPGALIVDDGQGTSDLDETMPDEVLRQLSKRSDRTSQISSFAVLEPQDEVLTPVSSHFMMNHLGDVSVSWEDVLDDVWLYWHVVAAARRVAVRLLAHGEFTGPPVLNEDGAALPACSDGLDDPPFCAGVSSCRHTGPFSCA